MAEGADIASGRLRPCIGCNLCMHVWPVESCISMVEIDNGKPPLSWDRHPNNPMRQVAPE
jgi:dihydropyrimidine dehydrogenase (NAD+) subunit PreA